MHAEVSKRHKSETFDMETLILNQTAVKVLKKFIINEEKRKKTDISPNVQTR